MAKLHFDARKSVFSEFSITKPFAIRSEWGPQTASAMKEERLTPWSSMLTKMQMRVVKVQRERETGHSSGQLACGEKCLFNWQLDASCVLSQLSRGRGRIARAGEATLECPVNGLKGRRTKNPLKVLPVSEHSPIILWTRVAGIHSPLSGHAKWPMAVRSQERQRDEKERARVDDRKMGRWRMKHPGFIDFSSLNLTDGRARARRLDRDRGTFEACTCLFLSIGYNHKSPLNIHDVLSTLIFR